MIKIKVPATSANIGPGFDCLGLALNKYAYFEVNPNPLNELIGFEDVKDNLFLRAYQFACHQENWEIITLRIEMKSDIPIARGLGSSAALIVGGIACAILLNTKIFDMDKLISLANQLEGHPDNVVPAIFGKLCASKLYDNKVDVIQYEVHHSYQFVLLIPDFTLSTELSRNVLPQEIHRGVASFNLSQIPFLLDGLVNGNDKRLRYALEDRLHQNVRFTLHPDFKIVCDTLDQNNYMYYLSGAGPSIMVILPRHKMFDISFINTQSKWSMFPVKIDTKGIEWSYES